MDLNHIKTQKVSNTQTLNESRKMKSSSQTPKWYYFSFCHPIFQRELTKHNHPKDFDPWLTGQE